MQLIRLDIKGYRGFKEKVVIQFPKDRMPTVFVGVNGAGKTAILESIIGCLKGLQTELMGKRLPAHLFQRYEVNNDIPEKAECNLSWKIDLNGEKVFEAGFDIRKTTDPAYSVHRKDIREMGQSIKDHIVEDRNLSIPIVAYYPTERIVQQPSLKSQDISKQTQLSAWEGAFESYIDYNAFFQWFRNVEDLENEKRLSVDPGFILKPIEAVRKAIGSIISGFSNPRVQRAFPADFVVQKNNRILSLNQLSHGEKMTLAMVGDLARRLAIANPGLENPLEGSGVVLIDEVDLHLHPKWQRQIVTKLQQTFPRIQFILTTHSPLIINHLHRESIFLLEQQEVVPLKAHPFNNYGANVEDTLKIIQKVESLIPEEVEDKLGALFNLIDEGDIVAAKALKAELVNLLDDQHPDLLKAETKIQFKELLD